MTRYFRAYPVTEPHLVYCGSTFAGSGIRKVLSNLLQSFTKAPKNEQKRIGLHDAVQRHPAVSDWTIEEVATADMPTFLAETRAVPGVSLLNDALGQGSADVVTSHPYSVVRVEVKASPELFSIQILPVGVDPATAIDYLFTRFRRLNAMRATRGLIFVEFSDTLVKALSYWHDPGQWTSRPVASCDTMTEARNSLSSTRRQLNPPLDVPFAEGVQSPDPRVLGLLRWLRDLAVPTLAELSDLDRQRPAPPPPLPVPGFITVLVAKKTGREKVVSVQSNNPADTEHAVQVARANTPFKALDEETWNREYYIAPPVYCGDLNAAKMIAATTQYLAANWENYRKAVKLQ